MSKKKYVFKILVAGQGGVGKTTLLNRAVTGKFIQNTSMTIGVEFHLLNVTVGDPERDDSKQVTLQAWDFGGQERFRFMLDSYVAGARGALLMYDLTRLRTLDNLEEWVQIVRKQDPNLPILFVGSKLDRVEDITVADEYAKEFLEPLNMFDLIKISSKDGTNVKRVFEKIARKILEINGVEVPPETDETELEALGTTKVSTPATSDETKATPEVEHKSTFPASQPFIPPSSKPAQTKRPFIPPSNNSEKKNPFIPPKKEESKPFMPPKKEESKSPPFYKPSQKSQENEKEEEKKKKKRSFWDY